MRIRIAVQFEPKTISVNYNYGISTAIKRWLKLGTPQFAEFIENSGYNLDPKKFELFTFSLKFEKMKMSGPSHPACLAEGVYPYLFPNTSGLSRF